MKLKYVGLKQQCTAFKTDTGITWLPGAVHEVKDALAAKMLKHPDVFVADDDKPAKDAVKTPAAPVATNTSVATTTATLAPGATVTPIAGSLDGLDKAELHAMAKEIGLKVHHFASADTVRAAIKAAQAK